MLSMYFLCHEFINVYTLWFIFRWHWSWWWWWWWWARWRLWFFPQDIPNVSLFPSMAVNLADLATKDDIPFARSIFGIYIFLLDPWIDETCLNARNWSLWLNEKYTLPIYIAYMYYQNVATRLTEASMFLDTYIHIYMHYIHRSYIYIYTYTFIHIIHTYILGVQKSSELFFVKFNLYSYVIVRKWLAA